MNSVRLIPYNQIIRQQVRNYITKKFYEIPYDEQYESRDFYRSTAEITKKINIPDKISEDLKNILVQLNPNDFGYLGYSKKKYRCKTREEVEIDKKYPLG